MFKYRIQGISKAIQLANHNYGHNLLKLTKPVKNQIINDRKGLISKT